MGADSVTIDEITAEIVAYLSEPDYYSEGWRQTREIADAMGVSPTFAGKRLERLCANGVFEKVLDKSNKAWWRKKLA
ncbi:MAG: hypothetical protein WC455_14385 [Dehalococcoidia bacterium]|jgi:DNA-binding Lrp family transcriptional regulator